jgi:hypothetical protein
MFEAEQPRQTVMIIIIVVYALIITDTTEIGTRKKCQQCLQVNIFTIRAVLSIDIDDSIQYLCITNDTRIFITGCWPFTWWCRSEQLPEEERFLARRIGQQLVLPSRSESDDDVLLEDHQVNPVSINSILGFQKMCHYSKHDF